MKTKFNFHAGIILLSIFMVWSCDNPINNSSTTGNDIIGLAKQGSGGGGGGGHDIGAGNNLSFPVIWSDGVKLTLRGTYGETTAKGDSFYFKGDYWYVQNDENNVWHAQDSLVTIGQPTTVIDSIDWGDNLEAGAWSYGSQVRVELVLYKLLSKSMTQYIMALESNTGENGLTLRMMQPEEMGTAEVWGSNLETELINEATVYSGTARLVIQKLNVDRDDPNLSVTWDAENSRWTGEDIGEPLFSSGVWTNIDGPGGYSAEVNASGKVIYGYNWITRTTSEGDGDYRITFVLDPNSGVTCNTDFGTNTSIVVKSKTGESGLLPALEPEDTSGGIAEVVPDYNLTYIDVRLTPSTGSGSGGGRGSGTGGGRGSGNGGGGHGTNK
ncbi:MAG TPA: hypothetical protein VJ991_13875 [Balneolales bacterium]|nr:hypothetical protein [Balneolales bacterium]